MKFSVEKESLAAGLQQVMSVVGSKITMPILSNVLIEAIEGDKLVLSTTNLDIGMSCSVSAKIETSGQLSLPVKKIVSIVRSLPEKDVLFESDSEDSVRISSGASHFKVIGLPGSDFPRLPKLSDGPTIAVKQMQLSRMLKSISYAQSKDENRYLLNGVYFSIENQKLNLIATDGRRLALNACECSEKISNLSVIIPARTIVELERSLGVGEEVGISISDKQISFSIGIDGDASARIQDQIYIISKVVEGKYPNYKQVIPSTTEHRIRLDRERFLEVIQRVSLVADEKNYTVHLKMGNNALEIFAQSAAYGEAKEIIPIAYMESDVKIAFNPQFLIDPLKVLASDEVYFEFKDEMSPGIIKTNDAFLCVIMPLRS